MTQLLEKALRIEQQSFEIYINYELTSDEGFILLSNR